MLKNCEKNCAQIVGNLTKMLRWKDLSKCGNCWQYGENVESCEKMVEKLTIYEKIC